MRVLCWALHPELIKRRVSAGERFSTMPVYTYQFVVVEGDQYGPIVRWTHLPDEEAALR